MTYQSEAFGRYPVMAQAIRAVANLVRVNPEDFTLILSKSEKPLVLFSEKKFLITSYQYMTSYCGFIFYTKSKSLLQITSNAELIRVKSMWVFMSHS